MPAYNRPNYEPIRKLAQDLSGGVNFESPSSKLKENQLTSSQNIQYYRGILRVDTGYQQFRQGPLNGIPEAQFQFIQTNGQLQTLLLTTQMLYMDNGFQWAYTGDNIANTTLTALTSAGGNTFTLAAVASLNNGDKVAITLDNNSQLQTTITNINVGTKVITTLAGVPVGRTAGIGNALLRPKILAGNTQFQPQGLTFAANNWFIFTNSIDFIQYYDGTNVQTLPGWNATVQSCRLLVNFHGFIIALDTNEGGNRLPQRVRWSDQNNPTVIVGGLAGSVDLNDTEDFILSVEPLGPWLIIYREASIMRRSFIGDPLQLFYDEYMVTGVGTYSQNSVANTGASHLFIGPEGFFRYSGGYDVESVGDQIFDYLLSPTGIINTSETNLIFVFYVAELDEVWIFVPTLANTTCDTLFRFDQGANAWWIRNFSNNMIGFGFIEAAAGRTWVQATEAWNVDTSTWTARAKTTLAPLTLLCDPTLQQTWLYDYNSSTDGGANIPWSFSTKDYESPDKWVTFDGVYAKGTGNGILVEISMDRGQTYRTVGTLNFGLTFTNQNINLQITGEAFRLRFSGTDPTFSLDYYRVDYLEATPW